MKANPVKDYSWKLEDFVNNDNLRYFSYGRYALIEGLKIIGVRSRDKILLPGFICRELLSAVNSIGAEVDYYPVNRLLQLSADPKGLPDAKAIIAVDYFGFPQNLAPFRNYCERTGAILIEDNAHGLFSRDEGGRLLGTRGDIGIFSLRKTIPMPDGAALILNNSRSGFRPGRQVEFSHTAEPLAFMFKQLLRKLIPFTGTAPLQLSTFLARYFRKIRTGYEIEPSLPDAEYTLPGEAHPCKNLLSYLSSVNIGGEISRRRKLYARTDVLLKDFNCRPVFENLPDPVVPYGYPFYSPENQIPAIKKLLRKNGLECFKWPALPDAINPSAPEHYKTVWLVSFLW